METMVMWKVSNVQGQENYYGVWQQLARFVAFTDPTDSLNDATFLRNVPGWKTGQSQGNWDTWKGEMTHAPNPFS